LTYAEDTECLLEVKIRREIQIKTPCITVSTFAITYFCIAIALNAKFIAIKMQKSSNKETR